MSRQKVEFQFCYFKFIKRDKNALTYAKALVFKQKQYRQTIKEQNCPMLYL